MSNNTQTKPINQIEVFRDGQYDESYVRSLRVAKAREIGHTFVTGAFTALEAVGAGIGKLVTPVALEIHDSMHHSDLRAQYFQRMHEEATEEIKDMLEL